ncbi:MAG TPA: DUF1786 family protein [Chloroflexia bacterium]|nr:DUF1786 family protein [Chloroflexia bacterium]
MRILCIDVGTGTQDILLFDSDVELENCVQMVMPSPTRIVASRVLEATAARRTLLLTGVTMGGGPCSWAIEDHVRAGLEAYATPDAARTMDDDLDRVAEAGVRVVGPDEIERLARSLGSGAATVEMRDLDLEAVRAALEAFGEPAEYDALAVAVFDHGAAPPGYSDRRFRFDYISRQMSQRGDEPVNRALAAFAAPADRVDPELTRLLAVRDTVRRSDYRDLPLLLMDTGPAALLGSLGDARVRDAAAHNALFVNVGNFHVLAFHIATSKIRALFEHHTGLLDAPALARLLDSLVQGTLTNAEVFDGHGHGALTLASAVPVDGQPQMCAVAGPRRSMLENAALPWPVVPAAPHGDMMVAGCYGLLRAFAVHFPDSAPDITRRLGLEGEGA